MLPPPLPCLSPAICPTLPSTTKMLLASVVDSSPPLPPFWPNSQHRPSMEEPPVLRVEIRCTCHIELLDAQFAISHNEQTNDFFVELLSPECRFSAPILCILFRFLPSLPEHLQIFPSSYGHWHRCGSVQRCPSPITDEPIRLHVHVHESYYTVEFNRKEVVRVKHKREFRELVEEQEEDHENGGSHEQQKKQKCIEQFAEKTAICCACLRQQKQFEHEQCPTTI